MSKSKSKKQKPIKSENAFNAYYPLYILGFIVTSWGNVYLLNEEHSFSWILVLFWILFAAILLLDSVYYTFTKDEIYLVHFWGYKQRIPWLYVEKIINHDIWSEHKFTYEVYYKKVSKGKSTSYITFLPRTPKIKKCLYKYYSDTTVGIKKKKR